MAAAKGPVQSHLGRTGSRGLQWGPRPGSGHSLGGLAQGIRWLQGPIVQGGTIQAAPAPDLPLSLIRSCGNTITFPDTEGQGNHSCCWSTGEATQA